jgi:hypothetical protein
VLAIIHSTAKVFHRGSVVFATILIVSPLGHPASAQERPGPAAEFAAGALFFADDGVVTEGFVGGSARVYVLPRVSLGPEIAYIRGDNHSHFMLTGNVTFDLVTPVKGDPQLVTPFVVVGAGLFQTHESFLDDENFASSEGAFTAGGGVRGLIGERMMLGVEARVGWELHVRVNAIVGVHLGR